MLDHTLAKEYIFPCESQKYEHVKYPSEAQSVCLILST